jgi:hypothetical protein
MMDSIFRDSFSDDEISMVTDNDLQPYPSADDSGEQTIAVEGSPEPETTDIEKCGPGCPHTYLPRGLMRHASEITCSSRGCL